MRRSAIAAVIGLAAASSANAVTDDDLLIAQCRMEGDAVHQAAVERDAGVPLKRVLAEVMKVPAPSRALRDLTKKLVTLPYRYPEKTPDELDADTRLACIATQ